MALVNPSVPPPGPQMSTGQDTKRQQLYTGSAPPAPAATAPAAPKPQYQAQTPGPAPTSTTGAAPAPGGGGGGYAGPNNPDPAGQKPAGISDSAWYGYTTVDSSKPLSWWQSQDQNYDPSAKGYERYKSAKLDQNGQPIQGLYEHPDACPQGTTAFGQHQCLPVGDPRVQGAGGPGGPGGQGGPGGSWQPSAEQTAYISSLTSLANQMRDQGAQYFGKAMPAISSSSDYWSKVLGKYGRAGVQEATAPAGEQIAAGYRGAEKQVRNLRGADKAAATAELARGEAGDLGKLAPEQQQNAAGQLGQLGVQTAQLAQGATGQAAQIGESQQNDATQRWGAQLNSDTQKWLGDLSSRTSWNIASLNAGVSREALAQNSSLAWAGLNQHADEFSRTFAQHNDEFTKTLSMQQQEMQYQRDKDKSKGLGGIFGSIFGGLGAIGGTLLGIGPQAGAAIGTGLGAGIASAF